MNITRGSENNGGMSLKDKSDEVSEPSIVMATREAKELHRVRNSFTFKIGIEIVACIKNPLLIMVLPFRIIRILFASNKKSLHQHYVGKKNEIFIIGLDRNGEFNSKQSERLASIVAKSKLGSVTLLNNSSEFAKNRNGIQWYRIPSVRENDTSRKEWNLLAERLLSSAISITNPSHVIYFGDYLYRGISNALAPIEEHIELTWFLKNNDELCNVDTSRLPRMNPILLPEYIDSDIDTKSIHKLLNKSANEQFILTDINGNISNLMDIIVSCCEGFTLTAIQRDFALPKNVELVVSKHDLNKVRLDGKVGLVLDDSSPFLSSLSNLGVPCVLIRTGKTLSPIIEEMIRDLEMNGSLVVIRRNYDFNIRYGIEYLKTLVHKSTFPGLIKINKPNQSKYVLNWLRKSSSIEVK